MIAGIWHLRCEHSKLGIHALIPHSCLRYDLGEQSIVWREETPMQLLSQLGCSCQRTLCQAEALPQSSHLAQRIMPSTLALWLRFGCHHSDVREVSFCSALVRTFMSREAAPDSAEARLLVIPKHPAQFASLSFDKFTLPT